MQNFEFPDFPTYPAYKPSGVKYLGDVPTHWDILPLKRIGRFRSGTGFPIVEQGQQDLELPFFKVSDMNLPGNEQVMRVANNTISRSTADRLKAAIFPEGTIIFPKVGGALLTNKRRILERPSCVDNNIMCCLVQRGDIDFVRHLFDNIDLAMIAKPGPVPSVNAREVRDIRVPLPPLPEQRAIAAYLDRKGDIARRYAHVARRIIANLRELRQVEIHDAVTHGLNEDAPLKPSGVEWLGDIPSHWDARRLKYWVEINKRTLSEKTDPDFEFRYIEIGGVSAGALLNEPAAIRFGRAPSRARRIVRQGDTIVSTVRAYLKAVWFAEDDDNDLVCSTGFAVLTPKPDAFPKFVSYVAQSDAFTHQVMVNSVGVAYPAISNSKLRVLLVPVPPLAEQRAIAAHLDAQTAKIDAAIAHYERMAELVAEYWTVLVADAVTGRIDLRQTAPE